MSQRFPLHVAYDLTDQIIASALKRFLERSLMRAEVFLSGYELECWPTIHMFQDQISRALLVLPVMTSRSLRNARVYFEAGAGFAGDRTVLLCTDGVRPADLRTPFSHLPSLEMDEHGLPELARVIARRVHLREPTEFPGLEEALQAIRSFIALRDSEASIPAQPGPARAHRDPLDVTLSSWHRRVREQLRMLLVKCLGQTEARQTLPERSLLKELTLPELCELAQTHGVVVPEMEILMMRAFEADPPRDADPRWRKMNLFRLLEGVDEGLRAFERSMG